MSAAYLIKPMRRRDLDVALGWAREEGWNPGLDDAVAFYAADASGFLMGWLDDEPIACISVVKYGADFAFLGLYIVRPAHRGKGYGKAIWDAGMASAAGRTIGLDGVVAQQDNYRKSGYALAHKSARWSGPVDRPDTMHADVVAVKAEHLDAILAYDRGHFPAERSGFLKSWLTDSPLRKSVILARRDRVKGYGTIRKAASGWKLGPLFAESATIADALLDGLVVAAGAGVIFIDIPEPNAAAIHLAEARGLKPAFETARMYRGPRPASPLGDIFGITTLELG